VYVLDGTPLPGGVFDRAGVLVSRNDGYGIFFAPLASAEKRPLRDLCYRVMGYAALGQSAAQDFDTGSFSEDLFAGMSGSGCRDTLLRQIEILARAAVAHPFAPVAHRLQDDFSFWHPWLDFYHLLLRHRDECTSVLDPAVFFTTGLGAAARMLAGGPHTVVQGTQYDH